MGQVDSGKKIGIQRRRLGEILQRRQRRRSGARRQDGADAACRAIALGAHSVSIIRAVVGVVIWMELLRGRAGVRHGGQHRRVVVAGDHHRGMIVIVEWRHRH